ncbi:MAG: hypothetical protein WAZ27_03085 [Minisyncoccia bacterium]
MEHLTNQTGKVSDKIADKDPAAIKFRGEILRGATHAHILNMILEKNPNCDFSEMGEIGFVTASGRFVDRKIALEIANSANQVDIASLVNNEELFAVGADELTTENLKNV